MMRSAVLALLLLAACSPRPASDDAAAPTPPAGAPAAATASTAAPAIATAAVGDEVVGRWNGSEGLFLEIKARDAAGHYPITLKDNLDTQADYQATQTAEGLTFNRGDDVVTIKRGDGADTGFKHLAGKTDCLILVAGTEGYCRG